MTSAELVHFLKSALAEPSARWTGVGIEKVAQLHVPDAILGRRAPLLRADLHSLWAKWFLESICDVEALVERDPGYAFIVKEVGGRVRILLGDAPEHERMALTSQVSQLVADEMKRRRGIRRMSFDRNFRQLLWERSGPNPRCWVCGHLFAPWALDRFVGTDEPRLVALPAFVDFVKPSGLVQRDQSIEIDHVVPVSRGGREDENLRLVCGWCNGAKGDRSSLYDVNGAAIVFRHPSLGRITVPRPFWVVRLLAIQPRCEWSGADGCARTTRNSELTVYGAHTAGSMNPSNLRVTCSDHHPLGHRRLVSRNVIIHSRAAS